MWCVSQFGNRNQSQETHLCSSPINPSFAIGVNVEQNQALHQVREDELITETFWGFTAWLLSGNTANLSTITELDSQKTLPGCTIQLRLQSQRYS